VRLLAAIRNIGALLSVASTYGLAYPSLTDQAIAQDVVGLVVVVPLLILTAVQAEIGSLRAYLIWLGLLLFTVYNYVIYTLSIHFGPFFLVWVGVLGLTTYALIGGFAALRPAAVAARAQARSTHGVGWFMIAVATLFTLAWLAQIVPAQIAGTVPAAIADTGTPTSPVHVLDLAIILPAIVIAGVLLLRRTALGYVLCPPLLVFLALTAAPIVVTSIVAQARGDAVSWTMAAPIVGIAAAAIWVLTRTLPTMQSR
jgi:hypothetical protein